jgi:hypothetical protein
MSPQRSNGPLRRLEADDGYVIAMVALMIIPIMAFVSLGVDLGAWYARAAQLQRIADAAALAAAPLTPDPVATRAAAQAVLDRNNIVCAPAGPIQCTFTVPSGSDIAYRVTLTDPAVQQFFSKVFRDRISITRGATAERLRPVPMGSPNNYLGTNELIPTGGANPPRENFWLAESGKCASKEQGERRMTVTDANWDYPGEPNSFLCRGGSTETNREHDPEGYTYVMNLAQNFAGTVHLEVYDPVLCDNDATKETPTEYGGAPFQLRYRVKDRAASPGAAAQLREWTPTNTDCATMQNRWVTMYQFVNPGKGQYYLQIADPSGDALTTNRNSNQFAIRARYDGATTAPGAVGPTSWAKCSTIIGSTTPGYRADCPQIHGYRDIGVRATVSGGQASFYLASIGSDYGGRVLEVTLWDVGEGASSIELLDPTGAPATFDWETMDCGNGVANPSGGCTGRTAVLDVSGDGMQPGLHRLSRSRYNDRPLRLSVTLPNDIAAAYGTNTWWRVRYTAGGGVTDRTTWSVRVAGDPVRLVATI